MAGKNTMKNMKWMRRCMKKKWPPIKNKCGS